MTMHYLQRSICLKRGLFCCHFIKQILFKTFICTVVPLIVLIYLITLVKTFVDLWDQADKQTLLGLHPLNLDHIVDKTNLYINYIFGFFFSLIRGFQNKKSQINNSILTKLISCIKIGCQSFIVIYLFINFNKIYKSFLLNLHHHCFLRILFI